VGSDRSYFPITKFSIEQSNGITSISDYLAKRTLDVFGVKNEIRVIKNFVNCELYRPDFGRKGAARFAPAGEKLLIHLSNFRPVKRVLDCVRILAEVRKHTPAHLLMAGDGPERGPAEYLARDLKVEKHITFLGKQDHVERLIPLAHVLLMPSDMESFGLVALEAMACEAVPVATRVGGVPELITDGEDGFLAEVGDIDGMAARVTALLTDEQLHYRMSKAGRWNAAERFCTDKIIPQYERYYEEVVASA
jgi:N-acetyl-alpha-D-glucosaminyl L-malate synthase BshA